MDRLSLLRVAALSGFEVATTHRLDDLPDALFPSPEKAFFSSRVWYETVIAHALPDGIAPHFVGVSENNAIMGVFPLRLDPAGPASLTTPYTCLHAPLFAADAGDGGLLAAAFGRFCRRYPLVRIDALDEAGPETAALIAGAKAAGLAVRRFRHFGNWHEALAGRDWGAYLAARPGSLRETIRRKLRRSKAQTTLGVFRGIEGLEAGIAAFEHVYARSWKEAEPFPRFNPALMRAIAPLGILRLFVLSAPSGPVAVQFWVVTGGIATVLKLAHDEDARALSPGTVLTAEAIRHLIDEDHIIGLDFGRGDDPYKAQWVGSRRQRIGLLLVNPRRPAGLFALARHGIGALTRGLRARRPPPP